MNWIIILLALATAVGIGVSVIGAHTRAVLGPVDFRVTNKRVCLDDRLGCELTLNPTGALEVNRISLCCRGYEWIRWTESQSYTDSNGRSKTRTVTRTQTHDFYSVSEDLSEAFRTKAGKAFSASAQFVIPADVPPSFAADDNAVRWELQLHVDIAGLPDVKETYAFDVRPLRKKKMGTRNG
jgi:hypothetical protein